MAEEREVIEENVESIGMTQTILGSIILKNCIAYESN